MLGNFADIKRDVSGTRAGSFRVQGSSFHLAESGNRFLFNRNNTLNRIPNYPVKRANYVFALRNFCSFADKRRKIRPSFLYEKLQKRSLAVCLCELILYT